MWKFLTSNSTARKLWSPNGHFLATVSAPVEIWGNQLVEIAFWQKGVAYELIYFHHQYMAHSLQRPGKPTFVYWSACGNWAIFYEFKRQECYKIVFLNLAENTAYEAEATNPLIDKLPSLTSGQLITETILANNYPLHPVYQDTSNLDSALKP